MTETSLKNYILCLLLIFIRESSSCNQLLDNNADLEEACFPEPKAKTETIIESVIHDSIDNPDDPSTGNSEQILFRFPRSEESASTFEETNDASPDKVNDPHLGSFFDYPSNSKIIVILILSVLLAFCLIYSICKCWVYHLRNMKEKETKSSSNDSVTGDIDSVDNISIGNAITTRTRYLMEFFRNPIYTLTRDYEVNVSTLNVANLSFSSSSEREQSSNSRSDTSNPFECDQSLPSTSDQELNQSLQSISSNDETDNHLTHSKSDVDEDLTDIESSNASKGSCREIKLDEDLCPDK